MPDLFAEFNESVTRARFAYENPRSPVPAPQHVRGETVLRLPDKQSPVRVRPHTDTQRAVYEMLRTRPTLSDSQVAVRVGCSERTVQRLRRRRA